MKRWNRYYPRILINETRHEENYFSIYRTAYGVYTCTDLHPLLRPKRFQNYCESYETEPTEDRRGGAPVRKTSVHNNNTRTYFRVLFLNFRSYS